MAVRRRKALSGRRLRFLLGSRADPWAGAGGSRGSGAGRRLARRRARGRVRGGGATRGGATVVSQNGGARGGSRRTHRTPPPSYLPLSCSRHESPKHEPRERKVVELCLSLCHSAPCPAPGRSGPFSGRAPDGGATTRPGAGEGAAAARRRDASAETEERGSRQGLHGARVLQKRS